MPSDVLGAHLDTWTDDHEQLVELVQGFLARFSYKPGWHFVVVRRPELANGVFVQVAFRAIDSRLGAATRCPTCGENRFVMVPISGIFGVPPYLLRASDAEGKFRHWLRAMLGEMEDHERDEWFRWDGKLPYDPHVGTMPIMARGP